MSEPIYTWHPRLADAINDDMVDLCEMMRQRGEPFEMIDRAVMHYLAEMHAALPNLVWIRNPKESLN